MVFCSVNLPGCMHDSRGSRYGNVYEAIEKLPQPFCCVCDLAFEVKHEWICKSGRYVFDDLFLEDAPAYKPTEADSQLTSLCQASEWGNGAITNVFRRLKLPLPTSNADRAYLLWVCILLHNFRAETMNICQIRTYFRDLDLNN